MRSNNLSPQAWLRVVCVLACLLATGLDATAALPADWQNWNAKELLAATGREDWATLSVEEQLAVADHVWVGFLSDGGVAAGIGLADFLKLADRFQDRLDATRRGDLAALAQTRIPSSSAELAALGVWDIWRMRGVGSALGVEDVTVNTWTRTYLQTSGQMFFNAGSPELGLLMDWANKVEQVLGTDMSQTRQAVTAYAESLASQTEGHSSTAFYAKLRQIGVELSRSDERSRPGFAQDIVTLVQTNHEAYIGLTIWNMDYLRKTARNAGISKSRIADWTLVWFLEGDAWKERATYREVNALYDWIFQARTHAKAKLAEHRLTDYLCDRLTVDPSAVAAVDANGMGLARVLRALAPRMDEDELDIVARHVISRLVQNDGIDGFHWHYENLASLFGTPSLRQELLDNLVDAQGDPRIKVGKLVTWMHRGTPEAAAWRNQLELKGADSRIPAEQRSRWLLLRADAASPVGLSVNDPTDAKTPRAWAEEALSIAPDEQTRLECLKWIVADDLRFNRTTEAEAILTQEAPMITAPMLTPAVEELQRRVSIERARD